MWQRSNVTKMRDANDDNDDEYIMLHERCNEIHSNIILKVTGTL